MVIQIVRFQSDLPIEKVKKIAEERAAEFKKVNGLIQKYYFRSQEGHYGGVYIWDSRESMANYRDSELAASVSQAYMLNSPLSIEINEIAFMLRE